MSFSSLSPTTPIAVLYGGWSGERSVSLVSGKAVADALKSGGYTDVRLIDVTHHLPLLIENLTPRPAVVFNALHGRGGEDGIIQGVLEMMQIPYTHSGVTTSAVAMDKALTKTILSGHDIPCPKGGVVSREELLKKADCDNTPHPNPPLPYPFVLKPVAEGSSLGIFIVHTKNDWKVALQNLPEGHTWWLAETYIAGRELTVPVLGDTVLPVIEISPKGDGWYDFDSKYTADVHADFHIPAPIPEAIKEQLQTYTLTAHKVLNCKGVSRSDWRYNPDAPVGQQLWFLEINTQPGMTPLSLVPASAAAAGISYLQIIEKCLRIVLGEKQ